MKKLAIFASGSGSNAEAIITHFKANPAAGQVALVVSNKENAYVLTRAQNHGIPTATFTRTDFYENPETILNRLKIEQIDFIVLAGFMVLFPSLIIQNYPNRIVNIHPALLPAYGGKGMYGDNVHRAVIAAGEAQSGITIHIVNDNYDDGAIVFQATVDIQPSDTADSLAAKIHTLEHTYFPSIIENLL